MRVIASIPTENDLAEKDIAKSVQQKATKVNEAKTFTARVSALIELIESIEDYGNDIPEDIAKLPEGKKSYENNEGLVNLRQSAIKFLQVFFNKSEVEIQNLLKQKNANITTLQSSTPFLDSPALINHEKKSDKNSRLEYFSEEKRQEYRVFRYEGCIYKCSKNTITNFLEIKPFSTNRTNEKNVKNDKNIDVFVESTKGELFSGNILIKHSQFLGENPVIFAGEWCVEAGEIKSKSNNSGHFQPDINALTRSNRRDQKHEIELTKTKIIYTDKYKTSNSKEMSFEDFESYRKQIHIISQLNQLQTRLSLRNTLDPKQGFNQLISNVLKIIDKKSKQSDIVVKYTTKILKEINPEKLDKIIERLDDMIAIATHNADQEKDKQYQKKLSALQAKLTSQNWSSFFGKKVELQATNKHPKQTSRLSDGGLQMMKTIAKAKPINGISGTEAYYRILEIAETKKSEQCTKLGYFWTRLKGRKKITQELYNSLASELERDKPFSPSN